MTKKKQAGYTLIELLIVIGLIGLTIGVTGDIILTLVRSYAKTQATNELERSSNFVVSKIEKEFKNAVSVDPISSTLVTFQTKSLGEADSHKVGYRIQSCGVAYGVTVNCIQRCVDACTEWVNVTDPSTVNVAGTFTKPSNTSDVENLGLNFKFTKSNAATSNTAFTGELVVQTTIVAKGTY